MSAPCSPDRDRAPAASVLAKQAATSGMTYDERVLFLFKPFTVEVWLILLAAVVAHGQYTPRTRVPTHARIANSIGRAVHVHTDTRTCMSAVCSCRKRPLLTWWAAGDRGGDTCE